MPYADPLTEDQLAAALAGLPDWSRDGTMIRRTATVTGFQAAVALVNGVAEAAEAANHHPDICIRGYRNVSFELTTHAAKALTRRDIELAAEIDRLIIGLA
jgi:4a-hydroxytetrahydrobiopterin dehydratase